VSSADRQDHQTTNSVYLPWAFLWAAAASATQRQKNRDASSRSKFAIRHNNTKTIALTLSLLLCSSLCLPLRLGLSCKRLTFLGTQSRLCLILTSLLTSFGCSNPRSVGLFGLKLLLLGSLFLGFLLCLLCGGLFSLLLFFVRDECTPTS
jgi:hypothetical protein